MRMHMQKFASISPGEQVWQGMMAGLLCQHFSLCLLLFLRAFASKVVTTVNLLMSVNYLRIETSCLLSSTGFWHSAWITNI